MTEPEKITVIATRSDEVAALKLPEAAAYIGMSERWIETSDIPRVRLGRAVRYLRADLDAYLLQRRDRDAS